MGHESHISECQKQAFITGEITTIPYLIAKIKNQVFYGIDQLGLEATGHVSW